jgi:hypothetical protein
MEAFALAPHVTPAVPVSVATAAPVHSTTPVALHPPLPLYLLNSSLLI